MNPLYGWTAQLDMNIYYTLYQFLVLNYDQLTFQQVLIIQKQMQKKMTEII